MLNFGFYRVLREILIIQIKSIVQFVFEYWLMKAKNLKVIDSVIIESGSILDSFYKVLESLNLQKFSFVYTPVILFTCK